MPASVTAEVFRQAMRLLAAGVTIITTRHNGQRGGLTATAVCSLSADPPQVLVCVNRRASAHDLIASGTNLCVNLLARRHQALARRFAGAVASSQRFATGNWTTLETGAPVLADALASFDCLVTERVQSSTHTIFIGQVVDVKVAERGRPLLYASGEFAGVEKIAARSAAQAGKRLKVARPQRLRGRR